MRKSIYLRILQVLLAAVVVAGTSLSCEASKSAEELGISLTNESVSLHKGDQFVTVTASGAWEIELVFEGSQTDWAYLTKYSGEGNSKIAIVYSVNASGEERSVNIVLKSKGGSVFCTLVQRTVSSDDDREDDDPEPAVASWLELPEITVGAYLNFNSLNMTKNGRQIRNFSYLFDSQNHLSWWVAYPLNTNLIGSGNRTDAWGLDPSFSTSEQAVLFSAYKGGYDRGHQLPSADRLGSGINEKTFYFTNMTPQLGRGFNQSIWAELENEVRNIARKSDTLYVVTGCVVEGATLYATDNNGKRCPVPVAYYKALLKRDFSSNFSGCAYYMEHKNYSNTDFSPYKISIRELEEKTGINFFVNLPAAVGETKAASIEATKSNL